MAYLVAQADVRRIPLPDKSVDLVLGSPPYLDCRHYLENGKKIGIARKIDAWVAWMLEVTAECLRVSRGAVVWVAAGKTDKRSYQPACEGLMWEWAKAGGSMYRPCYWHRNGIAGSGGDQWFRADVEYIMCFKRAGPLPWTDNTACGHPPKWAPGGAMSHRISDGTRVNQWGPASRSGSGRRKDGTMKGSERPSHVFCKAGSPRRGNGERDPQVYVPPAISNPGCLFHTNAGGGNMGNPLAHDNEAPFPEALVEPFMKSLCPPGGSCLDPFSGSGTTAAVAHRLGRVGIGFDLRRSQCELGTRRIERPHAAPVKRVAKEASDSPLLDFFGMGGT